MLKFPISLITVTLVCFIRSTAPGAEPSAAGAGHPGGDMAEAAVRLLASLDATQRVKAALTFDGDERENWHFVPMERAGLPLAQMQPYQQALAMGLLSSALGNRGFLKATAIMSLEQVLAEIEKNPDGRNPAKYFFAVFGTPGDHGAWGWRVEGHHLSVNLTLKDGQVLAVSPMFLGANPAEVREGPRQGLRVLASEEELGRELVRAVSAAGHPEVVFTDRVPAEILTGGDRQVRQLDPVGVLFGELAPAQQTALRLLVAEYAERLRPELAGREIERITAAGWKNVRFGWAGGTEVRQAYYYRVQGPTFLIEAANSQNNANHIHTVWRDPAGDFGRDRLGEHYHGHEQPHD
ncbi:MAG: DUF3500 domain-containing protein [Akkermansiaceae bacterium]|nr:DUF3500 domain-containing protein [Akkermansiaceae bacterium]